MTRYLVSFDAHAMDHISDEDMPAVARAPHAVVQEAINADVFVSTGGLENQRASIVATDGTVTDGPYPKAIGGFCVVEVPAREEALEWAAKTASARRCAVEVREIMPDPETDARVSLTSFGGFPGRIEGQWFRPCVYLLVIGHIGVQAGRLWRAAAGNRGARSSPAAAGIADSFLSLSARRARRAAGRAMSRSVPCTSGGRSAT